MNVSKLLLIICVASLGCGSAPSGSVMGHDAERADACNHLEGTKIGQCNDSLFDYSISACEQVLSLTQSTWTDSAQTMVNNCMKIQACNGIGDNLSDAFSQCMLVDVLPNLPPTDLQKQYVNSFCGQAVSCNSFGVTDIATCNKTMLDPGTDGMIFLPVTELSLSNLAACTSAKNGCPSWHDCVTNWFGTNFVGLIQVNFNSSTLSLGIL